MNAKYVPMSFATLTANLDSLTLLRHAEAAKAKEGESDLERPLTEQGDQQAMKMWKTLKDRDRTFTLLFSSPATRAYRTVAIASGSRNIQVMKSLYPEEDSPTTTMFKTLAYSPLATYLRHELGHTIIAWARERLAFIIQEVNARQGLARQDVLVGGHAVLMNAIAWAIHEVLWAHGTSNRDLTELSDNIVLGEAEAIEIVFNPNPEELVRCDWLQQK